MSLTNLEVPCFLLSVRNSKRKQYQKVRLCIIWIDYHNIAFCFWIALKLLSQILGSLRIVKTDKNLLLGRVNILTPARCCRRCCWWYLHCELVSGMSLLNMYNESNAHLCSKASLYLHLRKNPWYFLRRAIQVPEKHQQFLLGTSHLYKQESETMIVVFHVLLWYGNFLSINEIFKKEQCYHAHTLIHEIGKFVKLRMLQNVISLPCGSEPEHALSH